jgi:hypothetical protein
MELNKLQNMPKQVKKALDHPVSGFGESYRFPSATHPDIQAGIQAIFTGLLATEYPDEFRYNPEKLPAISF